MSGARLDQGDLELALGELEIPELDPDRAFEWSPALFAARAAVLEDLGRTDEAEFWAHRAEVAAQALGVDEAGDEEIIIEDGLIEGEFDDDHADADADADAADAADAADEADDADDADDAQADDADVEPEPSIDDEVRELLGEDDAAAGTDDGADETTEGFTASDSSKEA